MSTSFYCPRCRYKFSSKQRLISHLKRKKPCLTENKIYEIGKLLYLLENGKDYLFNEKNEKLLKNVIIDVIIDVTQNVTQCYHLLSDVTQCYHDVIIDVTPNQYECDYCKKAFKYRSGKSRHMKTCTNKPPEKDTQIIDQTNYSSESNDKDKQIEYLKQQLAMKDAVIAKKDEVIANTRQINISFNAFGNETLEHLNNPQIKNILQQYLPYDLYPQLMDQIYFNPNVPENHTISIPNLNKPLYQVQDGKGGTKLINKNEGLQTIYNKVKEAGEVIGLNDNKYWSCMIEGYDDSEKHTVKRINNITSNTIETHHRNSANIK